MRWNWSTLGADSTTTQRNILILLFSPNPARRAASE